jgi:hypothetical protein
MHPCILFHTALGVACLDEMRDIPVLGVCALMSCTLCTAILAHARRSRTILAGHSAISLRRHGCRRSCHSGLLTAEWLWIRCGIGAARLLSKPSLSVMVSDAWMVISQNRPPPGCTEGRNDAMKLFSSPFLSYTMNWDRTDSLPALWRNESVYDYSTVFCKLLSVMADEAT